MIKMIIADDERFIREGLHHLMDWEKYDIEVVASASDGAHALEKVLELEPDILLSDINMPEMDGIELAKVLYEKNSACKIIFLSAYSEFSYAQQAIRYGVYDYILKPINEEQLIKTVLSCAKTILDSKEKEAQSEHTDLAKTFLENNALRSFYSAPHQLDIVQKDILYKMGIIFDETTLFQSMLIPLPVKELQKYLPEDSSSKSMKSFLIDFSEKTSVILWKFTADSYEEYSDYVYEYAVSLLKSYHNNIYIYLSSAHTVSEIDKLYPECSFASLATEYGIHDHFIPFRRMEHLASKVKPIGPLPKLLPILTDGDTTKINQHLQFIFLQILQEKDFYQLSKLKLYCITLLDEVGKLHNPYSLSKDEWDTDFMLTLKVPITEATSIADLYHVMQQILLKLSGNHQQSSTQNRLICQTLNYIHNNYQNASLQKAAEQIYVSSTYLSRVFASEMNESFSRYLVRYRIQKAKEMMTDPQYKLYEIALAVGYADISHFSKAFKQIEGCSPQQFRNQYLN